LFVLTLGCSRKAVRLLSFGSSSRIWAELHEKAFRRLGGSSRIVVLDNLKEGVLVPDIYDPALNPLYRDVLTHYGCVALPCRIKDPDRKGKVERGVGHAKNTPLKGKRFESLEEAQAYLDRWETSCADTRIHGTTKRQVAAMFAEEKPFLLPLPLEPFRYYQHGQRVVHLDGCVEVEAAYYGLPPGWIGRLVRVQWDELYVRILDPNNGLLLREHVRQKRGWYRIKEEDHPKHRPLRVSQLLWRAGRRLEMVAFRPKTSPASEILVMMVLPSLEDVKSLAFPIQSTKTPRGCWPSINSIVDFGYTAVDLISFSLWTAGRGKLQNKCSSRTGQIRQLSMIFKRKGHAFRPSS